MARHRQTGTILTAALALAPAAPGAAQPAAPSASSSAPAACPARPGWTILAFEEARARSLPDRAGDRSVNWVGVGPGGALYWHGHSIASDFLRRYFVLIAGVAFRPATVIQQLPGASCEEVAAVAAMVEAAYPCRAELCLITSGALWWPPRPAVAPGPPPPPSPPSPPRLLVPARARANLVSYFSSDDYPAAALRNREEGAVAFRLHVGADGRVRRCLVTGSSGSAALDAATCRILTTRPRFVPARDAAGNPVDDVVSGRITWALPPLPAPVPPPAPDPGRAPPDKR